MQKNEKGIVSTGVLALIGVLVAVGLLGWYVLSESQKVNDEYDAADQANSSLIKPVDSEAAEDATDAVDEVAETDEAEASSEE